MIESKVITETKEMTHRERIMMVTGINESDYNAMVIEGGLQWIESNISIDELGIMVLIYSNAFWKWWNIQWDNRNKALMFNCKWNHITETPTEEFRQAAWQLHRQTHSIDRLNVFPLEAVLSKSYKNLKP